MKKRVLSMFMALALCLTLLPAPAWAAEADAPEGGAAQVTTAEGTEQVYGSFNDAWSAAIASEGSTLKLLSDVELSKKVGQDGLPVSEGSFTLDLNNKTLQGAIWNQLLEVSGTANITIKNGSLVNTQTGPAATATSTNLVALKISGGTVALDNVNLTSGINSEGKHSSALYITGGSLTVTGSTFTGEVGVFCENSGTRPALSIADATLNNGIFYLVADAQASDTAGLEAIFAAGSMLFGQDGKYIDLASKEYWHIDIENVAAIFLYTEGCIVKPHTHEVVNGACECGATFAASVTQNGAVTYYKDFHTALNAAKAGDTLTLLTDVKGDVTVTIDKEITFDLNGHRIYDLTVRCKITLKDSAGGTGKIAEWLRVDNGLNIGDLLEEGYALRNAGTGAWYGETEQTVGNVTVQQAPITSVTLTALNADGTAASTSIPYGTTGGIKLSASCTRQGAGELSCQWYTIGGTLQLINGATEPVYQLPADLSVGEYTYRVTFTADGYEKEHESIIGNCDTLLFLGGGNEPASLEFIVKLLGRETLATRTRGLTKGRNGSSTTNYQQTGRDLMTVDEVRKLDTNKAILFIRGEDPVIDRKYNLKRHPNIKLTSDGKAKPYIHKPQGAPDYALPDLPYAFKSLNDYEFIDMEENEHEQTEEQRHDEA